MSGFLYFFPNSTGFDADRVAACGLADVLTDACDVRSVDNCLDGQSGVIMAMPTVAPADETLLGKTKGGTGDGLIGHYPDRQHWQACDDGRFWVGYDKDNPPTPDELMRADASGQYMLVLSDGASWMIPTAKVSDGDELLPQSVGLDSHGNMITETLPGYEPLVRLAGTAFDGLCHSVLGVGEEVMVPDDFNFKLCCLALGTNYRITKWEIATLRLLTTTTINQIIMAVCDFPAYLTIMQGRNEAQKKTGSTSVPDTESTAAGKPG